MAIKKFIDDPRISLIIFYPRKTLIPNDLPYNIKILNFQISEHILIGGYCQLKILKSYVNLNKNLHF